MRCLLHCIISRHFQTIGNQKDITLQKLKLEIFQESCSRMWNFGSFCLPGTDRNRVGRRKVPYILYNFDLGVDRLRPIC